MATEPFIDTSYCDLDDHLTEQVVAHVTRAWRLGACRTCDGAYYHLLAQATLRFSGRPEVVIDTSGHQRPCAALVCTTCGEVRVLDLTVANVYERAPSKRPRPEGGPSVGPYR